MSIDTALTTPLTKLAAWKALQEHFEKIGKQHLRDLFANDPNRGTRLTAEAEGIYLDYSKHRITDETLKLLLQLAEESGLKARRDAMFSGEKINITEKRAVLHVALRAPKGEKIVVDGEDVVPAVHEVLDQASGNAPLEDKKKAVERFAQLKVAVQAFSDRAVAAGRTEEEVGDVLERFQFNALSKMERDLKAAINENAKPAPGKE